MSGPGSEVIRFFKGTPNWDYLIKPSGHAWPSRCEVCGKDLAEHSSWVDLGQDGFVVDCSEREQQQPIGGTDADSDNEPRE